MRLFSIILVLGSVLSPLARAAAEEPPPLTLSETAGEALAKSPAIAASTARADVAAARARKSRAAWLPRVSASETLMRGDNPVFVFGSLLEQGRFGPQNFDPAFLNDPPALTNARLAIDLRYRLFDRFQRRNVGKQARNEVTQAEARTDETRQRIRAEVVGRFYGLIIAQEKRDVAEEAVRSAEADAAAMRDRFEQGLLVESDVLSAEVQLASFRQRLVEADGDVAVGRAALATLVGRSPVERIAVTGTIPDRELPEISVETAIERGLASRGAIKTAAQAAGNASLDVATARSSRLPQADAFASSGVSWGTSRGDPDRAVGLVVSIDLFNGSISPRIAESRAHLAEARAAQSAARDSVTMEIVTAWHRAHAARERIALAAKSAERADAAARIVHDRYEQGLTTITEQLRAQTALVTAKLELLAARYEYVAGYAELLRATGGLTDVDLFL